MPYIPKSDDEKKFVKKHIIQKVKKLSKATEDDKLFNGVTKMHDREKDRHGYNPGDDEKVYESKMNDLAIDLEDLSDVDFQRKYKRSKKDVKEKLNGKRNVKEEKSLSEILRLNESCDRDIYNEHHKNAKKHLTHIDKLLDDHKESASGVHGHSTYSMQEFERDLQGLKHRLIRGVASNKEAAKRGGSY